MLHVTHTMYFLHITFMAVGMFSGFILALIFISYMEKTFKNK